MNRVDRGLIWLLGLAGFAAILVLILLLSLFMSQSLSGRADDSDCQERDPSCQQEQTPCEETKSGNTGDCPVGSESQPPHEVMLRHEFMVKPGPGPDPGALVTERRLRAFIPGKIICNGSRFALSGFIYFDRAKDVLDGNEAKKIREFMTAPGQVKKLWLFSFTSPDGEGDHNSQLARQRACAVREEVVKKYHGEINIQAIGEDNPINGIANSRSAVIAACWGEAGEARARGKSNTTGLSCP